MNNIFFMPEYAQLLEKEQEEARLMDLMRKSRNDSSILYKLSDDELEKLDHLLDREVERLRRVLAKEQAEIRRLKAELCSEPSDEQQFLMDMDISELDLSIRAYNNLRGVGIVKIGELCSKSQYDLINKFNLQERDTNEVAERLLAVGLSLNDGCAFDADLDLQEELELRFNDLFEPLDDEDF